MMKKTTIASGILILALAGCTGNATREAAAKAAEAEIEQIETVTSQIDSTITEIEEASVKLDTLINEL